MDFDASRRRDRAVTEDDMFWTDEERDGRWVRSRSRHRAVGGPAGAGFGPRAGTARQRTHGGGKKCGSKKKKHERSGTRQPYMNSKLSTPYLSSKFKH